MVASAVRIMANEKYILSTRPLPGDVVLEAAKEGIIIETIPFIRTEPSNEINRQEILQYCSQNITAIFTSMNAVEVVADMKGAIQPRWKIFCTGEGTAALVQWHFPGSTVEGTADSAKALSTVITKHPGINEVVFFCGNKRRPELPDALAGNNIHVKEMIVYNTTATPQVVERKYDAVLFFSPSAVDSFFSVNRIDEFTVLFAIGQTTRDAIKKFTTNEIATGSIPGKVELAREAVAFFRSVRALR